MRPLRIGKFSHVAELNLDQRITQLQLSQGGFGEMRILLAAQGGVALGLNLLGQ